MHQTIRNVLGVAVVIAVLLVGAAAINFSNSYGESIQPSSFRSFTATGEGKATAIPDVAEFSFQVVTQGGTDVASLQSKNTAAVNKAIGYLKSQGVADKDIKTQYYNIDPRYQTYNCRTYPVPLPAAQGSAGSGSSGSGTVAPSTVSTVQPCPPSSIVGYTVTQSVDVKVRDFSKIGGIMNGVVAAGANQVGALSFTLDDPTAVQNQARANAIANAKAEAQVIANAGGFKIGRLLGVQESGPYPIYEKAYGMGAGPSLAAPAAAPTIQPGSQEVDETITLQYEIQ